MSQTQTDDLKWKGYNPKDQVTQYVIVCKKVKITAIFQALSMHCQEYSELVPKYARERTERF